MSKIEKIFVCPRLSNAFAHTECELIDYELPKTKDSPYIVDDSSFVPISEALKQLSNVAPLSDSEMNKYYDFADGTDTGISIPITRSPKDYSDITEVSTAITDKVSQIVEGVNKVNQSYSELTEFSNVLKSVKGGDKE